MTRAVGRRISLDLLVGFEAAARSLSFTKAAREMSVTQSAVSRQIKLLEEQVGVVLFKRMNRGLALTADGQALFLAVSSASKLIANSVQQLREVVERKVITIAAAAPFVSFWLAPRLPRFSAQHAGHDIRVLHSNDAADLDRGVADVGIWHFNARRAPNVEPLAVDEVLPVCAPSLSRRRDLRLGSPEDLVRHVLLKFENVEHGRRRVDWVRWLDAVGLGGLQPAGSIGFSQYDQVIQAAVGGDGVALGRLPLVAPLIHDGRLMTPFPHLRIQTGAWYILMSSDASAREDVGLLVDWCRRQALADAKAPEAALVSPQGHDVSR